MGGYEMYIPDPLGIHEIHRTLDGNRSYEL